MLNKAQTRVSSLKRGLAFALIPAILLIPGTAYFTVCPSAYSALGVRVMHASFLASEIWALRWLLPSLNTRKDGKVDALNLFVWAACTIGVVVILVSILFLLGRPRG